MSGLDHGEDPGFHGIGKCVPGADDGGQIRVSRSLCRINCCTWRCDLPRMCVFLRVYAGGTRTSNPQVAGSNPAGRNELRRSLTYSAAHGAAVGAENVPVTHWLDACPVELTDETKAGILAMVETTAGAKQRRGTS